MKYIAKSLIMLLPVLVVFGLSSMIVFADENLVESPDIKVLISYQEANFEDVPIIADGHLLLPLRALLIKLGVQDDNEHIVWNNLENSINIIKDSTRIYLKVGDDTAYVNDRPIKLDGVPIIYEKNHKVYIPVGFVSQALGKTLIWFEDEKTVSIINISATDAKQLLEESAYAQDLIELKKYEEALIHLDKALQLDPEYSFLYVEKSWVLSELKRYDEALQVINKAIELSPKMNLAYDGKSSILYELGRYDEALEAADKCIEIDPSYYVALNLRGRALHRIGKSLEALDVLNKCIDIDPNFYPAYINKANVLNGLGRYDEALEVCDKVIKLNPEIGMTYAAKGVTLMFLGKIEEALTQNDIAIQKDSAYAPAYYNRACCYSLLGQKDNAIIDLKTAIEFDSKFIEEAKKDKDFDNIKDLPEFQEIIKD